MMPFALAGGAEGLAGTRACPNRSVIGPSGEPQGVAPDADSGEEMALGKGAEFCGVDLDDGSLVDDARRDVSGGYEIA